MALRGIYKNPGIVDNPVHPVDGKQSVIPTSSLRHVITRLRTDLEVCTCTRPRAPAGHAPASVWTRTRWSCAGAAAASS